MKLRTLKSALLFIALALVSIFASSQELHPNYSEKGKLLLQELNRSKDTLTLKSDYPITNVYVINRKSAMIHQVYAKQFKICIKDWPKEKHTVAVRLLGDIITLNIDYEK